MPDVDGLGLFERLVTIDPDAEMYFRCLSALHKARLKYELILRTQRVPTLEQVGPRGLLQYGTMSARALVGFLFWRKWFFDIDNRAGQETGYLFEPIIANAIGGTPVPAKTSPVRRRRDASKGRQVDCLLERRAYELKIRLTIAASGQGRWAEELEYPADCQASGYTPVLIVFDNTVNPKLDELTRVFHESNGEVFVGQDAWAHLKSKAGNTMGRFVETYVRAPIERLLRDAPEELPEFKATMTSDALTVSVGEEALRIPRMPGATSDNEAAEMPEDIADA